MAASTAHGESPGAPAVRARRPGGGGVTALLSAAIALSALTAPLAWATPILTVNTGTQTWTPTQQERGRGLDVEVGGWSGRAGLEGLPGESDFLTEFDSWRGLDGLTARDPDWGAGSSGGLSSNAGPPWTGGWDRPPQREVPEPGTVSLLLAGLLVGALFFRARRPQGR
jgi:PEP-CTERM motif